ncbi:riboflavin biosynthesis protein RibD [Acrocarpospora corrugata]|uniref:Riboflavin biosynthesis protein RibD n=1 Tax=Acrocarpospora corrugata TaxID=35763 RepID=A0A5M3VSZ0_9ACTN|nr:dihydrofolate reductase family protein [Acrocarpospora corrugata]GER99633.1 riboflavin biosynthesis protein RibD [Acrocarpospora corrugata]
MRKIVLWMSVSIDGFFEGPNHDLDWHLVDDELHWFFNRELAKMGAFLNGRVTYELMAEFWPTADQAPDVSPPMAEFARIWREMPKIVYSTTLDRVDWNSTLVRAVVPQEVLELKARPGGDLAVGGATLAAEFMRHDLIDEYWLFVHPIVLGEGTPLFQVPETRTKLRLTETRAFGNGVVLLRYRRPAVD